MPRCNSQLARGRESRARARPQLVVADVVDGCSTIGIDSARLGSGEEEQIEHEVARADPESEYLSVAARAARRRSIADVLLAARDVLVLRRGFGVGKGLGLGLDDSDVSEALNAGEIAEEEAVVLEEVEEALEQQFGETIVKR